METSALVRIAPAPPADRGFDADALASAAGAGSSGPRVAVGGEIAPELALDWWLHAVALPGFAVHRGDRVEDAPADRGGMGTTLACLLPRRDSADRDEP
ncbi:MAG: hypothetical protein ACE5FL_06960 [Myxococcota bacterium]